MTADGPAAAFMRRHRQEFFTATPLLFASVDQRWLRGARLGENLGIGLTIAQRIVEAHAGTIVAHENVSGGATFTVTLPRSATSGSSPDGRAQRIRAKDSVSAVGGD